MRSGNSSDPSVTLVRLRPGEDLRRSLARLARQRRLQGAVILSGVGSLTQANLRFAGRLEGALLTGPFEIVSITGTVAHDGLHVHLSISGADGTTLGGHLMPGCKVHTTCELALMALDGYRMRRVFDAATGYRELQVIQRRR